MTEKYLKTAWNNGLLTANNIHLVNLKSGQMHITTSMFQGIFDFQRLFIAEQKVFPVFPLKAVLNSYSSYYPPGRLQENNESKRICEKSGTYYNSRNMDSKIRYIFPIKKYRGRLKGVHILLSNSQAGPGRTVRQEQEDILATTYKPFS